MPLFRADLHIHTVLSPCGDVDMAPAIIVRAALDRDMDMIAITDHNSTLQCRSVRDAAAGTGLTVLAGAEITAAGDIHALALVPWGEPLAALQEYLSAHLPDTRNDPALFGHQLVVDVDENVLAHEPRLLTSPLRQRIGQVERKVHELGGIFIPAHVLRHSGGLLAQSGLLSAGLRVDALELSPGMTAEEFRIAYPELADHATVEFSDAHRPEEIGRRYTIFDLCEPSFEALGEVL